MWIRKIPDGILVNKRSGLKGKEQQEGGKGNPQAGPEDAHEKGAAAE